VSSTQLEKFVQNRGTGAEAAVAAVIVTVLVVVAVAGLRLVAGDLTPTTAASRATNVDIIHTTARAVEGQAARAMIVVAGRHQGQGRVIANAATVAVQAGQHLVDTIALLDAVRHAAVAPTKHSTINNNAAGSLGLCCLPGTKLVPSASHCDCSVCVIGQD